jgi:5-methylcytosine-specific restriction endonuclease McrA
VLSLCKDNKAELVKKVAVKIPIEILIRDYLETNSSYKVAERYNLSATAVKRLLKEAGVLRTQNAAASERNNRNPLCGKYVRTEEHKENLSSLAKERLGEKNAFFGKNHSSAVKADLSVLAKQRTKKRNSNYKDGKTIRRPRDFKIAEFAPIRNRVFNRDNHTCYYCRVKGGYLHAHHILPYWIVPEAFLDDKNLITVCKSCHFIEAHKSNWCNFDTTPVTDFLLSKYSLNRERLNELTAFFKADAIV